MPHSDHRAEFSASHAVRSATPTRVGVPMPAIVLASALAVVGMVSAAVVVAVPFNAAAFGGLTVPVVIGAGLVDGLNPCAFALLVLLPLSP